MSEVRDTVREARVAAVIEALRAYDVAAQSVTRRGVSGTTCWFVREVATKRIMLRSFCFDTARDERDRLIAEAAIRAASAWEWRTG